MSRLASVLLIVAGLVMGVVVSMATTDDFNIVPKRSMRVHEIRAERIALTDSSGAIVALLVPGRNGAGLSVCDKDGKILWTLPPSIKVKPVTPR